MNASEALVAHTWNPSYSGGTDQEGWGSKPAQANSSARPHLKKPFTKTGLVEQLKVKALSSSPSTTKKKKKKKRMLLKVGAAMKVGEQVRMFYRSCRQEWLLWGNRSRLWQSWVMWLENAFGALDRLPTSLYQEHFLPPPPQKRNSSLSTALRPQN
jgi:ribosomal protein S21